MAAKTQDAENQGRQSYCKINNEKIFIFRGKIYIPNQMSLKELILDEYHRISYSGHPSYQKILTAIRKAYFWPGMHKNITEYLIKCLECQQVKVEHQHLAGLLQPIPVPEWKWEVISLDFITGLPGSKRHNESIMVVVD